MRIAIVTDAWRPQVNGVVTTLSRVGEELAGLGHEVRFVTPAEFGTVPLPTYPEIRLAVMPYQRLARGLEAFRPEAVHIATEGPLGHAARRFCRRRGQPFTTAYHTQFPRYLRMRVPLPESWSYAWLRRFHAPAVRTMVPTASMRAELTARGFRHLVAWCRGVDSAVFRPYGKAVLPYARPISVYVGRVAVEKSVADFLAADVPGTKLVIGDGPARKALAERYPEAIFSGYLYGEALARHMAAADVFVFPSRTDTFGLTMLEAMACGLPVAAHPVTGPRDVVSEGVTGALDEDLGAAIRRALTLDPQACLAHAARHTWRACAESFLDNLGPVDHFRARRVGPGRRLG